MTTSNPLYYYIKAFKNYDDFKGRATRKEYWMFQLINFVVECLLFFVFYPLIVYTYIGRTIFGVFINIYFLVTLVPALALAVRRLHDSGESGWCIFAPLANFIFLVLPGTPGPNKYGPAPEAK